MCKSIYEKYLLVFCNFVLNECKNVKNECKKK